MKWNSNESYPINSDQSNCLDMFWISNSHSAYASLPEHVLHVHCLRSLWTPHRLHGPYSLIHHLTRWIQKVWARSWDYHVHLRIYGFVRYRRDLNTNTELNL